MDTETSPRHRRAGNLGNVAIRKRVGRNHSISCNGHRPYFAVASSRTSGSRAVKQLQNLADGLGGFASAP